MGFWCTVMKGRKTVFHRCNYGIVFGNGLEFSFRILIFEFLFPAFEMIKEKFVKMFKSFFLCYNRIKRTFIRYQEYIRPAISPLGSLFFSCAGGSESVDFNLEL